MDTLSWDTPPTEEEMNSVQTNNDIQSDNLSWDTPPTDTELKYLKDVAEDVDTKADNVDIFSEIDRWKEPVKVVSEAYDYLRNGDWSMKDAVQDFVAGEAYGIGEDLKFVGETYSPNMLVSALRVVNKAMGGEETQGALESLLDPIAKEIKKKALGFADDPNSASFAVGTLTAGTGTTGAVKSTKAGVTALKNTIFPTTSAADLMAKKIGVSRNELLDIIKDIPREDQVKYLAMMGGQSSEGVLKQSVRDSDALRTKLAKEIDSRTKAIDEASGAGDIIEIEKNASEMYTTMRNTLNESGLDIDLTSLTNGVDEMKTLTVNGDVLGNKIRQISNELQENPIYKIGDAIDLRESINEVLRTAKGKTKAKANQLKDNLDSIIKRNVPEEYSSFVSESVDVYRNMKNQKELVNILGKSGIRKTTGGGKYELSSINYSKAKKKIIDAGLDSPETMQTLDILDVFSKKFNNDFSIFGATKSKGVNPEEGMLTVWSELVGQLKSTFWRFGEYGENVKLQKAISASIDKANTPVDFATKLIRSKDVPNQIKDKLRDNLSNISSLSKADLNRIKTIEVDEVIDAQRQIDNYDIIDTELMPKQLSGNKPKAIGTDRNGKQLPQSKDLTSKESIDAGYTERKREERLIRLEEINEFKGKKRTTPEERQRLIDNMKAEEAYKAIEKYVPDNLKGNPFLEEALLNGSTLMKDRVGKRIQNTRSGMSRVSETDSLFISGSNIDSYAIQMELKPDMVKRIKSGKGTPDDFAALRVDAENLAEYEAKSIFKD